MEQRTKPRREIAAETPHPIRLNMLNDTTRDAVLIWWSDVVHSREDVQVRSFVKSVSLALADRHVSAADDTVRDLWNFLYPQYAQLTTQGIDK